MIIQGSLLVFKAIDSSFSLIYFKLLNPNGSGSVLIYSCSFSLKHTTFPLIISVTFVDNGLSTYTLIFGNKPLFFNLSKINTIS